MEAFSLFISIITIIIVLAQQSRISALDRKIKELQEQKNSAAPEVTKKEQPIPKVTEKVKQQPLQKSLKTTPKYRKKRVNKLVLSDKFLSNWAGILGSMFLVMGFSFLGVSVALTISPFMGFIIFVIVSLLILASSIFIERMKKLERTALWLRSASGAIYLFTCFASIGIPGLIWVDNSIGGILLLLTGVLANIALGQISKKEIIASAHVFLSLVALSIAPAELLTFLIAVGVTLYGIYLTYRNRWDRNLLIIISLFFAFHLYWHIRAGDSIGLQEQATALITIVIISLLTLLSHYRNIYSVKKFDSVPFLTHFLNWIYLGTGLYLYSSIIPIRIILLALGSIIALFIARNGKRLNIRWLYITDTLVANFLMILAILSFYPRGVNPLFIAGILLIEGFIFTLIVTIEKDKLLVKVSYLLNLLFGVSIVFSGVFSSSYDSLDIGNILVVGISAAISTTAYVLFNFKSKLFKEISDLYKKSYSYIPGAIIFTLFIITFEYKYGSLSILSLFPLIYFGQKLNSKGFKLSYKIVLTATTLLGFLPLLDHGITYTTPIYLLAFIAISLGSIFIDKSIYSIYLLTGQLAFSTYIMTNDLSIYFPGVLWILMSIGGLELSKKIKPQEHLKYSGVSLLALYLLRHFTSIYNTEYKLVFDIIVLLFIGYWIFRTRSEYSLITYHLLEIILFVGIIVINTEVESNWKPVAWSLIAIGSLLYRGNSALSRLRIYSILFLWGGAFHLSFITTTNSGGIITGLLTMGLLSTYLALFKSNSNLPLIDLSKSIKYLSKIRDKLTLSYNKLIYFPVFISMALFILFEFNKDIITLMFVVESLIIFILSIRLKEKSFKLLSMAGIAGSMVRLILFDLNNSETVIRALVFIGMGTILVAMNIIYNKFREY